MSDIIAQIDAEIASLQRTRALLAGAVTTPRRPGPPKGTGKLASKKKKRDLSPEGRARIVAAAKARWAAQKKATK